MMLEWTSDPAALVRIAGRLDANLEILLAMIEPFRQRVDGGKESAAGIRAGV